MSAFTPSPPGPYSAEERAEIERQLERLVTDSHFKQSRRYPSFLRYVVTETLAGHTDRLKERTLGIEIFGKNATYDTGTEPIVRVTAAEIRKRIALYYQDPAHRQEMRVSLPPGSYVPQFEFASKAVVEDIHLKLEMLQERPEQPLFAPVAPVTPHHSGSRLTLPLAIAACLLVLGGGLWFGVSHQKHETALEQFWSPILKSENDRVMFCVADQTGYGSLMLRDAAEPTRQIKLNDKLTAVIIDDLSTVTKLAGVLESRERRYTLQGESVTTLNNLRSGPSVIVGAFDNEWALRMLAPLRFHFANNASMTSFSILDSAPGGHAPWIVDRTQQLATNNYEDYAIVGRFVDSTTGQPTLIAAGIGRGGTVAAGEFLTSPKLLAQVLQQMSDPAKRNVEIVLTTRIIDGEPGTPTVSALHTW